MNQHFLQSSAWEKFQQSLGRKVFHNRGEGWEYFAILERGTGNSRLYCPFGPTAINEEALRLALKDLAELGKKLGVTFLRVGPIKPTFSKVLSDEHWKKATYVHLQPEHTHVINLQQPEEEIIASMAQPVRNCYRNYHKKGVTVHQSQNPDDIVWVLRLMNCYAFFVIISITIPYRLRHACYNLFLWLLKIDNVRMFWLQMYVSGFLPMLIR